MSLGPAEIIVVLLVALVVLGPNRLPEAARQVGKALAELKKATSSLQQDVLSGSTDSGTSPSANAQAPETRENSDPPPTVEMPETDH